MTEEKKGETIEEKQTTEKSAEKKEIEEEEKAKMMVKEEVSRTEVEKKKKVLEEAVEGAAKRRAPIGGIRVPGFLRVVRSRDKAKEDEVDAEEGTDLLESPNTADTKSPDDQPRPQQPASSASGVRPFLSKISFKSVPFLKRKKQPAATAEEGDGEKQPAQQQQTDDQQQPQPPQQQQEEGPRKPRLINAIKLPLASLIPSKLKAKEEETAPPAGLASMETLDESNGSKHEEKMETVKLDNVDADPEKAALGNDAESTWAKRNWPQYLKLIKEYRIAFGGVVVFLLLLLILLIYIAVTPKAILHAPIENGRYIKAVTSCGHVEGVLEEHIFTFRGIPYARPPLGELRFSPPQALTLQDCWNGTFKAHNSSLRCWTMYPNGTIDGTEDCLSLDVYTPQVRYDSPLPVVVAVGISDLRLIPALAKSREMVVVIPRVRLGPLGFTATHHLSLASNPRTSGNYGLADLVAALQWVSLNVVHFGGDKEEVTVLGWREGATLATALTVIQRPEKLLKRLWLSSGSAVFPNVTLEESQQESQEFIQSLVCSPPPMSADCLRKLDVEDLLDSVPDSWRPAARGNLPSGPEARHQWLVQDGVYIRESPYSVWERQEKRVEVVIGTTQHSETNAEWFASKSSYTPDSVRRAVESSQLGKMNLTEKVFNLYNASVAGLAEIVSDIATVCPLYFLADRIPSARFYLMSQYDDSLVYGGSDIEAILGWSTKQRPEARRASSAMLHLFQKYAGLGQLPVHRATRVGQDVFNLKEGLPRCLFWREAGIVPAYSWVD